MLLALTASSAPPSGKSILVGTENPSKLGGVYGEGSTGKMS
ncbi:MAG: hypothetical protein AB4080_01895 [Trichodesmium sp.]